MSGTAPAGGVARVSRRVMNLSHVLRQCGRRFPDRIGLVWGERSWTWREIDARVDAIAHALAARGVAKGDRVLVQSKNCNQMFESMFACFRLGAVWVPTNYRQTPDEVAYLAASSGACAMICQAEFAGHAEAARAAQPAIRTVIAIGRPISEMTTTPSAPRMPASRFPPPMSSTTTPAGSSTPPARPAGPRRRC